MPDLTISLTAQQAQRVAAALGVSTQADVVRAVKEWLKNRVQKFEARESSSAATYAANVKVDQDFAGF